MMLGERYRYRPCRFLSSKSLVGIGPSRKDYAVWGGNSGVDINDDDFESRIRVANSVSANICRHQVWVL